MSNFILNSLGQEVDPLDLKIFRVLSPYLDPKTAELSPLGLKKVNSVPDKGKVNLTQYFCSISDEIVVEKHFKDIRDDYGVLIEIEVTLNWYNEGGSIGLSKTEIIEQFNKFEAETEERKRRYRQFDYLRATVKNTDKESFIKDLSCHYYIEINWYQNHGITLLSDKMEAETDTYILSILNAEIERNDGQGTTTVKKAIQYQMSVISIEDL